MLVRRLRLNSGLAFDFAEGARASPRRSTASQHKRHSFRPRHSASTSDDQAHRFNPSAMPDLRAAAGTPGTALLSPPSPLVTSRNWHPENDRSRDVQ